MRNRLGINVAAEVTRRINVCRKTVGVYLPRYLGGYSDQRI